MKLKRQVKMVLVGYLVVALISVIAMNRIEKLESMEDVATYNEKVALNVQ